jgi:hypothetical protein
MVPAGARPDPAATPGPRCDGGQCEAGYREMEAYRLLLERYAGIGTERRHDGRVAVDRSNLILMFQCALVLRQLRDRLRQRRAGTHCVHAGLLRPPGDRVKNASREAARREASGLTRVDHP